MSDRSKQSLIKVTISASSSISDWCCISNTSSCFLCFFGLELLKKLVYCIAYTELYIANHSLDLISSFSILKETFSLVLIKIETKLFLKLSWWIFQNWIRIYKSGAKNKDKLVPLPSACFFACVIALSTHLYFNLQNVV